MQKPLNWISWIFATVGLAMAGGAFWAWSSSQRYLNEGIETTGRVIDLEYRDSDDSSGTYAPVVEFTDREGTQRIYRSSSSSNPPAYKRGEQVTLYYLPDEPERAMIDGFDDRYLLPAILGVFGLVFGGIGFGIIIYYLRQRQRNARLEKYGIPIQAKFVECYRDTSTSVNGRHPWRVVAQAAHPASGKQQDYVSDMIWVDLTEQLRDKRVTVLIDPQDPDSYGVDLDNYMHDNEEG